MMNTINIHNNMGCKITAYVSFDQTALATLAAANGLDVKDYKQGKAAAKLYVQQYLNLKAFDAEDFIHMYDKAQDVHEIWTYCSCKFVSVTMDKSKCRKAKGADGGERVALIRPEVLPLCLDGPPIYYVRDAETAREVAEALEDWFPDDDFLQYFARWLRDTAQWCDRYECD